MPDTTLLTARKTVSLHASNYKVLAILAAITLFGGWLRFSAVGFGLPDKYRPDEEYMVSRALGFQTDWNPHFAIYPAAQMYLEHEALWFYGTITGYRGHFRDAYASNEQSLAYRVTRSLSALMGTLTIPAIYLGASELGPIAGLSSAAIWSCATLPVQESKYATADA